MSSHGDHRCKRLLAAVALAACLAFTSAQDENVTIIDPSGDGCNPSPGVDGTSCAVCPAESNTTVSYQVCCCTPYPALVVTEPSADSCQCKTRAGWGLILLAVLVPILIIGDIMLICYCCYKGKCCCFKPSHPDFKDQYNVHEGLSAQEVKPVPTYAAEITPATGVDPRSPAPATPTHYPLAQYGSSPQAAPPSTSNTAPWNGANSTASRP